jgi:hypothetical protein
MEVQQAPAKLLVRRGTECRRWNAIGSGVRVARARDREGVSHSQSRARSPKRSCFDKAARRCSYQSKANMNFLLLSKSRQTSRCTVPKKTPLRQQIPISSGASKVPAPLYPTAATISHAYVPLHLPILPDLLTPVPLSSNPRRNPPPPYPCNNRSTIPLQH